MKMKQKRDLYSCMNARFPMNGNKRIYCRKNHILPVSATVLAFEREEPLIYKVCANCPDFEPDIPFEGEE